MIDDEITKSYNTIQYHSVICRYQIVTNVIPYTGASYRHVDYERASFLHSI
jgi:hypothetical protein